MKKLIKYYSLILTILLFLNNVLLASLSVKGILYKIIMYFLIIINIFMLLEYRDSIKYKKVSLIMLFLLIITAKNALNLYFILTFIFILLVIGFKESIFIKIVSICSIVFGALFFYPIICVHILAFGIRSLDEPLLESEIYEDTHYLCNDSTEVFVASAGAFDKFHYYKGNFYKIINIDDIININIRFSHETSEDKYEEEIKNNKCVLVKEK